MKFRDLIRHLERNGGELLREGGATVFMSSRKTRKSTAVPRHREINDFLAKKICKDLEIPAP